MSGPDDITAEELRDLSLWLHHAGYATRAITATKAADEIDSLRTSLAEAEYELQRWKEVDAKRPDWEKLWAEVSEKLEAAERERDAEAACATRWQTLQLRAKQERDEARARIALLENAPVSSDSMGLRDLARQVRELVSAHPYGCHEPLRLLQDYTSHIELLAGLAEANQREDQMTARIAALEEGLRQALDELNDLGIVYAGLDALLATDTAKTDDRK